MREKNNMSFGQACYIVAVVFGNIMEPVFRGVSQLLYYFLKLATWVIYMTPCVLVLLTTDAIFFAWIVLPILVFVIFAGPLEPYCSRLAFCVKLWSRCRRLGFGCHVHHSLASFWKQTEGFDVEISDRHGEVYSICFFRGNPNEKSVLLREDGVAEVTRYLIMPRPGRGAVMASGGRVERVKCGCKFISYRLPTVSRGKAILLFSPSPLFLTVERDCLVRLAGNGEELRGCYIYTARGFLDYLKRQL